MNHIQLLSWLFKNVTHIIHLKEFNICHPAQKPQKHFIDPSESAGSGNKAPV